MTRAHRLVAALTAVTVAYAVIGSARADRRAVRVTIVSDPAIRAAMHEVLRATPELAVVSRARAELELRATVVELTRTRAPDGLVVRARVTVVVTDARGGAVRAMLGGRAGASGGTDAQRLSQNALRAAVRGALRTLPEHGRAFARR